MKEAGLGIKKGEHCNAHRDVCLSHRRMSSSSDCLSLLAEAALPLAPNLCTTRCSSNIFLRLICSDEKAAVGPTREHALGPADHCGGSCSAQSHAQRRREMTTGPLKIHPISPGATCARCCMYVSGKGAVGPSGGCVPGLANHCLNLPITA
eukprot:1161161-Pelagomonas_calceolata.AAC.7